MGSLGEADGHTGDGCGIGIFAWEIIINSIVHLNTTIN